MNSAGTIWMFFIMVLILADIFAREVFNAPIAGTAELVGYSIVGAVYLQLAHSLHVGRFTNAELLIDWLKTNRPIAASIYQAVFDALGVFVFLLIAYGTYYKLLEAWPDLKFGVEGTFAIHVWPLRAIILVGAIAVAIEYAIRLLTSANQLFGLLRLRAAAPAPAQAPLARQPVGWGYTALLLVIVPLIAWIVFGDFSRTQIGMFSLIGMLLLIFLGMHVGVALITLGFVAIWIIFGNPDIAINTVKLASNEFLRNYFFGVVPLFVMMGLLINESDIGRDMFNVARWMLSAVKGGLGVATVVANAVFAAITGSSIASAAVFTKIATPHMIEHGYTPRFAVGTVAGSSVLGMLIPPSLLLIIYAFVAEQSVGILFLAAIVPGLILALAMGIAIIAMAHFWPSYVGRPKQDETDADEDFVSAGLKVLPVVALIILVLGGIYGGLFTPVEAGAVGAAGALIIALLKRRLTWAKLWKVMIETGHTTVAVLFLILAANIYGRMLAISGLPQQMGELISSADLGFGGFMGLYVLLLIILGMFLDSISIMLILLPLILPIVQDFGADLVWFGIITVIAVEMGLLTPPLGICVYVVRSTLDDKRITLQDIFAGAFPFVLIMLGVTVLLILFPTLSLMFT